MEEPRKLEVFQGFGVPVEGVMPDSKLPSEIVLEVEQVVRSSRGKDRVRGKKEREEGEEGKMHFEMD